MLHVGLEITASQYLISLSLKVRNTIILFHNSSVRINTLDIDAMVVGLLT